jgi:hypothetical protein
MREKIHVTSCAGVSTFDIPVQADYLPMRAMQSTLKAISVVQQRPHLNPDLAIAGVLVTMTDHTTIRTAAPDNAPVESVRLSGCVLGGQK